MEALLKSLKMSRQVMVISSAILIIFGGVILTLMQITTFPIFSYMAITGKFTYLISAVSSIFYFVLEWIKIRSLETMLINDAKHVIEKITTYESLSDKILKWTATLVSTVFGLFIYGVVTVIVYRIYDDTV